jgi:hypothetical protein
MAWLMCIWRLNINGCNRRKWLLAAANSIIGGMKAINGGPSSIYHENNQWPESEGVMSAAAPLMANGQLGENGEAISSAQPSSSMAANQMASA